MFMNNNAHILCEKEQVTKQFVLCSMISSYVYIYFFFYSSAHQKSSMGLTELKTVLAGYIHSGGPGRKSSSCSFGLLAEFSS